MNYLKEAASDLKNYSVRKQGAQSIRDKIKFLEDKFISLKGVSNDEPIKGGASKQEDKLIANIYEREQLQAALHETERMLKLIEKALECLSENDKYILELFYINRPYDYRDKLCEKFCVEEAQIYRMKDAALRKFTMAMYGIIEL